jgi:nicotinic acid mononucleotide adenylyltransferase
MVDSWEAEQPGYCRTLRVLQHVEAALRAAAGGAGAQEVEGGGGGGAVPRVVLVCGADVVQSMRDPSVWPPELLEAS